MKNNLAYRLSTFIIVLLGLGLFVGASFSPAFIVQAETVNVSKSCFDVFVSTLGGCFYGIVLMVLFLTGLLFGLYEEKKAIALFGSGLSLGTSFGFLYVLVSYSLEFHKAYMIHDETVAFTITFSYFAAIVGIALLIIASVFAIIASFLPSKNGKQEENA